MDYVKMTPDDAIEFLRHLRQIDLDTYEIELDGKILRTMTDVRKALISLENECLPLPFSDELECDGKCPYCRFEDDCRDEDDSCNIPGICAVTFNDPATIIQWEDGTKTVVKCASGQQFDEYTGFCAAVCKKLFGSSANAISVMEFFDTGRRAQHKAEMKAKEAEENKKSANKAKLDKELRKFNKYLKDIDDEVYKKVVHAAAQRKYDAIRKASHSDDDSDVNESIHNHEFSED